MLMYKRLLVTSRLQVKTARGFECCASFKKPFQWCMTLYNAAINLCNFRVNIFQTYEGRAFIAISL